MTKFKVKKKDDYDYVIEDTKGSEYRINLEFYDSNIDIDDYIYMDESILKEDSFYSFGVIKDNNIKEKDIIKVIIKGKEYYLQRYYG